MIAILLALAVAVGAIAYGWAADSSVALLAGWLALLLALGLSQLPVFRRVRSASTDLAEAAPVDDGGFERYEPRWEWPDRKAA